MADGAQTDGTRAKIRCDACPVLCYIAEGRSGACDRYANHGGALVRLDPLTILESAEVTVSFLGETGGAADDWDGDILKAGRPFVTAIGAGTTYPDYKPAPFIISQEVAGADMVTVVTEGIFSYCGAKVKIDTDRHIGDERAVVRCQGEPVGHVMTSEYGSKMLSLGGVEHLTGGTKAEGRVTCDALMKLCNCEAVKLTIDDGATVLVQAGQAPVINGVPETVMRVGCGSAAIGMFAAQWAPHVDEVVVVDDHITGVLSEHQAGKLLDVPPTGIKVRGRKSTPGRYFQVAAPGTGWGGTDIEDPLTILKAIDPKLAWPGLRLLMVSTTGEQSAYFILDADLVPQPAALTPPLAQAAERVAENCEPEGYVWPGGGITVMADVTQMPSNAFGYVPTSAIVAPIEFTLRLSDYLALGGHRDQVRPVEEVLTDQIRRLPAKGGA